VKDRSKQRVVESSFLSVDTQQWGWPQAS